MDVVWLVVDSLSFSATPFANEGPNTMPNFGAVASEKGVVFTNAYAPGPLSPSSHAAMLTGELPSTTGMHEAHPYFERAVPTIAERLSGSYSTHLLSLNMWLFQGLDRGFEHARDFSRQYLTFRSATDPKNYFRKHDPGGSTLRRLWNFAIHDGRPFRSLVNYVNYRRSDGSLVPSGWGDGETYQYAGKLNNEVKRALSDPEDSFVLANYMDVHPPYDASDEALARFAPDTSRAELPVGTSPERHIENEEKSYDVSDMERLYRAVIWDFDRKLAPFVEELIDDGTFVLVTSDHGIWNRDTAYSENRLRVPLVIFSPDHEPATVPHTVDLRSIPRTIHEAVHESDGGFSGQSLLDLEADQLAVTEIIHHPNDVYERTGRVDVTKEHSASADIQRDLVLIKGDARLDYVAGSWSERRGPKSTLRELRDHGEEILQTPLELGDWEIEFDETTRGRLEDLGYM